MPAPTPTGDTPMWIKSRVGLVRCRRVKRLAADLDIAPVCAVGHLHAFWHEATEDHGDGDVTDWTDREVAEAAAWPNDGADLRAAMRRHGFLVPGEDDPAREFIGDWANIGGGVISQRERNRLAQAAIRERRKQADEPAATPTPTAKTTRKPKAAVDADPTGFDRFWAVYPRRDAKTDAKRAWSKLDPDPDLVDRIVARVTVQATSPRWLEDGGRFIPLPATYLNGRRWEDEGATVVAIPPTKRLAI